MSMDTLRTPAPLRIGISINLALIKGTLRGKFTALREHLVLYRVFKAPYYLRFLSPFSILWGESGRGIV